jgi:hypothetical protein
MALRCVCLSVPASMALPISQDAQGSDEDPLTSMMVALYDRLKEKMIRRPKIIGHSSETTQGMQKQQAPRVNRN